MKYNTLGATGLFVSELCFGTMTFGDSDQYRFMGALGQDDADALLGCALEAGVNFVDTADTYSGGESERITGQAIKNLGVRREEIVIATKVFGEMGPGPNSRGASRSHILDGAKASLTRLQTDYIDLYQLHGFDPATPMEESLAALNDLVRLGMVRYVGVSNWAAWQIVKALGISEKLGLARFASLQAYYTLVGRDLEREIVPMLRSEGVGLLVWSPLAGGFLSGKYRREQSGDLSTDDENSRRSTFAFPPVNLDRGYAIVDVLQEMADAKNASVAQLALAWLLHQPSVSSVILGAKKMSQLQDNLGAVEVQFTEDERTRLDEASRLPAEYPGWMLDMWSAARAGQLAEARG